MLKSLMQLTSIFFMCVALGFGIVEVTQIFHPDTFTTIRFELWPLWSVVYCFFIGAIGFATIIGVLFTSEAIS